MTATSMLTAFWPEPPPSPPPQKFRRLVVAEKVPLSGEEGKVDTFPRWHVNAHCGNVIMRTPVH